MRLSFVLVAVLGMGMFMQNACAFVSSPSLIGLKKSEIRNSPAVSLQMKVNLLQKVETLKVLTAVSKAGLLSKVENSRLLTKLEKQVLCTVAVKRIKLTLL